MTEWYNYSLKAEWTTPHKIKGNLKSANILKNNRVVFNIFSMIKRLHHGLKIPYESLII